MPKIKTKRSAAKRFRATGTGRFKRGAANHRHILTKKATKRKRHLRADGYVDPSNQKQIEHLLPYA